MSKCCGQNFEFTILDQQMNVGFNLNSMEIQSDFFDYVANRTVVHYKNKSGLPKKGSINLLYVVNNKEVYIWDAPNQKYFMINAMGAVGDGKFTLKQNGTIISEFTANQDDDLNVDFTTPVNVSELTNDEGYIRDDIDKEGLDINFEDFFN